MIFNGGRNRNSNERKLCALRVWMSIDTNQEMFRTTFTHTMIPDASYTIVYGKYSKLIVSILSEDNVEMLITSYI